VPFDALGVDDGLDRLSAFAPSAPRGSGASRTFFTVSVIGSVSFAVDDSPGLPLILRSSVSSCRSTFPPACAGLSPTGCLSWGCPKIASPSGSLLESSPRLGLLRARALGSPRRSERGLPGALAPPARLPTSLFVQPRRFPPPRSCQGVAPGPDPEVRTVSLTTRLSPHRRSSARVPALRSLLPRREPPATLTRDQRRTVTDAALPPPRSPVPLPPRPSVGCPPWTSRSCSPVEAVPVHRGFPRRRARAPLGLSLPRFTSR